MHIWHQLRENDEKELEKNPKAKNLVSLCRDSNGVGVVDCGLENKKHCHHKSIFLYNPKKKERSEKQNPRENMVFNSYLHRVRWKDEQSHQTVWLAWTFLRGIVPWYYVRWLKKLIPIFGAIWNDILWKPENHPVEQKLDFQDLKERESCEGHDNLIPVIRKKCSLHFTASKFDSEELPKCTKDFVRKVSTSPFKYKNAEAYVQHLKLKKEDKISIEACKEHSTQKSRKEISKKINSLKKPKNLPKLPENWRMVQLRGIPSKYKSQEGRTSTLIFDLDSQTLVAKFCTCKGGLNPHGCSHCMAFLFLIGESQGVISKSKPSKSEIAFQTAVTIPNPNFSEEESSDDMSE